ncbi:MAG: hypothetical protein EZS28_043822 [Streblomastix strix]|uniref:Uncharacterized protein n=1 Tax=Streblomastix strix TaxID=222440 RepID=A0A5J4TRX0_9EUKA|nr:MAG: hypothetical protein EZS28_043822 [Streblomastix strix]
MNPPQTQINEPRLPSNVNARDQQDSNQRVPQVEQAATQIVERPRQNEIVIRSVFNLIIPPAQAYSQQQTSRIPLLPYTTEREQQQRQSKRSIFLTQEIMAQYEENDLLDEAMSGTTMPHLPPYKIDIEVAQPTWNDRRYDLVRDPRIEAPKSLQQVKEK